MRLARFVAERSAGWAELETLLDRASGRPERLGPDGVRRLGALYRATAADLALARRAFPQDPVTGRLHALVVRARQHVYVDSPRRPSLAGFLATGYWRRVQERPALLGLAAALLLVPMALAGLWGVSDPAAAVGLVPGEFRGSGDPIAGTLTTDEEAALASQIYVNNIRVCLGAVAGGILLGLGTAALTLYNGTFIGAIGGIAVEEGEAETFFALVVPHGVLELSCIVVSAYAGLRIGASLVDPGRRTRLESLRAEVRPALELVLGTIPWLVLAGLVEGFVTGSAPGLGAALAVGIPLGAVFWALVVWRGGQARARAFARR